MEDYQYTPLSSPTSIRVLQLHISKTENTSTTSFSLKEVDLQENPKYEALSYTWGQATSYDKRTRTYQWAPTEICPIQISNTGVVRITRNLCDLFENLIEGAPLGRSVSSIWADQVCINQNDVQERNSQVAMMKDIYAQAWRTLIWLGKPDSDMLVVANLLEVITTIGCNSLQRTKGSFRQVQEDIEKVFAIKSDSNWQDDLEFIRSIVNTLNKSWFSRAWIVQEVVLSQEPLLLFGKKTFAIAVLDNLVTLAYYLEAGETHDFRGIFLNEAQIPKTLGSNTLKQIQKCRHMIEHDALKENIFMGVLATLAFCMDASDPRDRTYAFLAFQGPNENQIVPDYGIGINDAYTIASESIVKSTKSLSILGLVRGPISPGSLPSWVVDWRVKKRTQGHPFDGVLLASRRNFDACSGYQHQTVDKMTTTKCLPVRGKRVSEIVALSSVIHHWHLPLNQRFKIDEVLNSLDLNLTPEKRFSLEQDQDDLFKRVLLVLTAQDMSVFKSLSDRENAINDIFQVYQSYDREFKVPEKYPDLVTQINDIGSTRIDLDTVFRDVGTTLIVCQKRVFYSGHGLFGLGPKIMEENDLICILHGSAVPIVLREQEAGFEVIGQCYYENWMHGDLVDWGEDEGDLFNLI